MLRSINEYSIFFLRVFSRHLQDGGYLYPPLRQWRITDILPITLSSPADCDVAKPKLACEADSGGTIGRLPVQVCSLPRGRGIGSS